MLRVDAGRSRRLGPECRQIGLDALVVAVSEATVARQRPQVDPAAEAEGVDAGSDRGLARIATRVGLGAADIQAALDDDGWRAIAEANRIEMLSQGLWGVPSFRVEGCAAVWGQDRLWMVEDDLIAHAKTQEGET